MNKSRPACLLLPLVMVASALAQGDAVKIPDTSAARQLAAFIKAFNSANPSTIREFHKNNDARPDREELTEKEADELYRHMRDDLGDLEVFRILESSEKEIVALIHTKKNRWIEILCGVEQNPPHKIAAFRFEITTAPAR